MSIELSSEQQSAYDVIMNWHLRSSYARKRNDEEEFYLTLGGYAGTGKTTLISKLVSEFNPLTYNAMSYTGKAVNVLHNKGIRGAATIHSTIYTPAGEVKGSPRFRLKGRYFFENISLFIIDEASMIPRSIHEDLMRLGVPTLYVGDHGQLEPIQQESEPFNLMKEPDYTLEEVHRHALDNPILQLATSIRKREPVNLKDPKYHNVKSIENFDDAVQDLTQYDQIICARNDTRVLLNKLCRQQHLIKAGWKQPLTRQQILAPCVGDKVMCYQNNNKVVIYNGQSFIIKDITCNSRICPSMKMDLQSEDYDPNEDEEENIIYDLLVPKNGFSSPAPTKEKRCKGSTPFDFGYAITCHKAQGSEYENVLVVHEPGMHAKYGKDPTRWLYTAVTRAKSKLTMTKK